MADKILYEVSVDGLVMASGLHPKSEAVKFARRVVAAEKGKGVVRVHPYSALTKRRKGHGVKISPERESNPSGGIRAQVRRLPTGQVQIKIPLKQLQHNPAEAKFSVVRGGANYWILKRRVYSQHHRAWVELADASYSSKAGAEAAGRAWQAEKRQQNPVRIEDAAGFPFTQGIHKLIRYGDKLLRLGNTPQDVSKIVKQALGSRVEHAVIIADDGKGNRAYNPRMCNPSRGTVDKPAAHELELFVDSDADLYRQQYQPILKNLATKKARGIYRHDLAVKLFMYLMESGAKKYAKEYSTGSDWHTIFNVPTRQAAAERFADSFETEYDLGNYDRMLPKKYQKKANPAKAYWQFPWVVLVKSQSTGEALSSISAGFPTEQDARIYRSQIVSRGLHRGRILELLHNTGTNQPGGVKVVSSKVY